MDELTRVRQNRLERFGRRSALATAREARGPGWPESQNRLERFWTPEWRLHSLVPFTFHLPLKLLLRLIRCITVKARNG